MTNYDERQRKLEDALREGFVARRDKRPIAENAYDRPALRKRAEKLTHGEGKDERPLTKAEINKDVEHWYEQGSCGTRTCWDEGYLMADQIAKSQGEQRLMEIPLQTVRSKSTAAMPKFGDPHHIAMFGEDEVPFVKVSRADNEYRERQRLAAFEGRTLAPALPDDTP